MTRYTVLTAFLLAAVLLQGCEKKAVLEGRVTDAKGQPIPHVKITALQDTPVSGYSNIDTETDTEGRFTFTKLYPQSDYTLVINSEATGLRQIKVKSGADGHTTRLPSDITFRFITSQDAIVTDSGTGLQWAPDPNIPITWSDAKKYIRTLNLGGFKDWRMPSRAELLTLENIDSGFPLNDCCVWTSEAYDSRRAWYVNIYQHFDDLAYVNNNSYRVLAVRTQSK